jgi:hypothetical protein
MMATRVKRQQSAMAVDTLDRLLALSVTPANAQERAHSHVR